LVKWKELRNEDNTWEDEENLHLYNDKKKIREYEKNQAKKKEAEGEAKRMAVVKRKAPEPEGSGNQYSEEDITWQLVTKKVPRTITKITTSEGLVKEIREEIISDEVHHGHVNQKQK